MTEQQVLAGHLTESLGHALRSGDHGLSTVPGLLRRVLEEEAWRDFVTQRGERVQPRNFEDYVTTPPLKGLGGSVDLVDRIVGRDDLDLLRLLKAAKAGRPGRPRRGETGVDSTPISKGEGSDLTADRLAREAPDEYAAVKRGEKTIHRAAVDAGIRRRRASVRLDDPESAARSLRRHMSRTDRRALARLLAEEE